jgi:hypothetical protein
MAALAMKVPEWAHAHLLQPDSTPGSSNGSDGSPPSSSSCSGSSGSSSSGSDGGSGSSGTGQTLAALLRPLPQDQLQLGDELQAGTNDRRTVCRGTVSGQPAVIKRWHLSSVEEALETAAEVRIVDAPQPFANWALGCSAPQIAAFGPVLIR